MSSKATRSRCCADANTDRRLIPGLLNWEIPVTWFQAFNPFMIFAFTPFIVALWGDQAKRGKETSTVTKMAMGCIMVALSYLVLAAAVHVTPEGAKATWLWLFAFFALITLGELYLSPVGLSLFARVAPIQVASVMMGCWLATSFLGNFLAGYLGSFWEKHGSRHLLPDVLCDHRCRRRRHLALQRTAETNPG